MSSADARTSRRGATRRDALVAGIGVAAFVTTKATAAPAAGATAEAIRTFAGGAEIRTGGVTLSLPPLVEDGDHAPLSIALEAGSRARRIGVFSAGNPTPLVAMYRFGPDAASKMSTNIRLWRTQTVTVVAEIDDGTFRSAAAEVVVTLAACRSE